MIQLSESEPMDKELNITMFSNAPSQLNRFTWMKTPWSLLDVTAQALEDQDEPPDNHMMFSSGTLLYSGKT